MTPGIGSEEAMAPQAAGLWLRNTLGERAHVHLDSRTMAAGDGFIACAGRQSDGRDYIAQALARGARAVLMPSDERSDVLGVLPVPSRRVAGLSTRAGEAAAAFYGDPSATMRMVAITGTNGKTSCANWIASGMTALADGGKSAAAIGTLGVRRYGPAQTDARPVAEDCAPASLTTPDPVAMQRCLATLRDEGVHGVALEASSIGLDQNRLAGVAVNVAVFTNLSRDHLDYHGSMSAYEAAKRRLFEWSSLHAAVFNGDDPAAAAMLTAFQRRARAARAIAYGFEPQRHAGAAQERLRIVAFESAATGSVLSLDGDFGSAQIPLALVGRFNAANATAVCATWVALGMPFERAVEQLALLQPVNGRMQIVAVDAPAQPLVVVDYAHTPQALEAALGALVVPASARGGRLWCVFGCGGDRDPGKRPMMAAAAQTHADRLVLTSDNPRSESPQAILLQMLEGLSQEPALVEPDRATAIAAAIALAGAADVVLIAGKGHETTQEINGRKLPFSDVEVAAAALRLRAGAPHA